MRTLIAALLLPSALGVLGQDVLYRSPVEYAESRGQVVEGPIRVEPYLGRFVVLCRKDGKRMRTPARKVWGFMNRGALYRIEREGFLPVRLMAQGPICYWENGLAHLHMQRDSVEVSAIEYGAPAYLSHDLGSEIVPALFKPDDTRSPSGKFRLAWPGYAALLERIGEDSDMDRIRQAVVDYNVAVEEGRMKGP